mmetsp:Transcript_13347/g.28825  ORF Transcript_13347/g.28825 Transcript_13347/m.28825 type:complete len:268 (+) Transcript_13347:599-1402(+)
MRRLRRRRGAAPNRPWSRRRSCAASQDSASGDPRWWEEARARLAIHRRRRRGRCRAGSRFASKAPAAGLQHHRVAKMMSGRRNPTQRWAALQVAPREAAGTQPCRSRAHDEAKGADTPCRWEVVHGRLATRHRCQPGRRRPGSSFASNSSSAYLASVYRPRSRHPPALMTGAHDPRQAQAALVPSQAQAALEPRQAQAVLAAAWRTASGNLQSAEVRRGSRVGGQACDGHPRGREDTHPCLASRHRRRAVNRRPPTAARPAWTSPSP